MKYAKHIQRLRMEGRNGEPRPRMFVVLKENLGEQWVQEAIARGDYVQVLTIPWYMRLWWFIKKIFGRRDSDRSRQKLEALGTKDPRDLSGAGSGGEGGGGENGGDLF